MFKKECLANKLYALAMMALGVITTLLSRDITVAVFIFLIAIPVFFAKKNYIVGEREEEKEDL